MRHAAASACQVCAHVGSAMSVTKWATWAWNDPARSFVPQRWVTIGQVSWHARMTTGQVPWHARSFKPAAALSKRNNVEGALKAGGAGDAPTDDGWAAAGALWSGQSQVGLVMLGSFAAGGKAQQLVLGRR